MRLALRSRRRGQHARMRQLLALLLAAAVAVAIPAARADQFEYVQLPDAQAALRRLQIGDVVHLYCAACGETASRRMTCDGCPPSHPRYTSSLPPTWSAP